MLNCTSAGNLIAGFLEAELAPKLALQFAEHMQGCTNCKIRLHRERRLKQMLEDDLDDQLILDESFTRTVMEQLPKGPPPKTKRKLFRLAAWALPILGAAASSQWFQGSSKLWNILSWGNGPEGPSLDYVLMLAQMVNQSSAGSTGFGFSPQMWLNLAQSSASIPIVATCLTLGVLAASTACMLQIKIAKAS